MSSWVVCCAEKDRRVLGEVVTSLDVAGGVLFAGSGGALRRLVSCADPGELGVVVGPVDDGVSDINLAAAVANDGNARCVVLARREVSGSLRSRAARAGIDLVVELPETGGGAGDESASPSPCGDGGRPGDEESPASPPPSERAPSGALQTDAPVIVLCSGRGGVGKTTLAVALACTAARWGMRVCLVDLDLSCGNAHGCFGVPRGSDLAELARAGEVSTQLLSRLGVPAAPGVSVVGPCARPETSELAVARAGELMALASREYDLVVVDTSTTFTDVVAQAAQLADRLVLVSDGRPGTVSALARLGGLAVRLGVARTRIARLENRADPRGRANFALARAEVGLEAARVFRVVEGGGEVSDLLAAGQAAELVEPGYPFADSVAETLAQLLQELGALPESEEARRAAEGRRPGRLQTLFGARREAR